MRTSGARALKKQLGLFDVYVISTGAMFSSGFFLLPGIAAAETGPSIVLAYLLSGLFIVPAMLSYAELATAMPKAGGTYYFLDRTLGPMVGTVGGIGTWVALVLKSAFALIGMGAYLGVYFDVPIKPVAIALTVAFASFNVLGAKQTTGLLRVFVVALLSVLVFFVSHGLMAALDESALGAQETGPYLTNGVDGLLSTVGLVFVSYIGLTKVASLAEEVHNPDRNIPLGTTLALASVTTIYVVGVFIMVRVMGTAALSESLTPVADTVRLFGGWLPEEAWVFLVVAAATAAFASMSNAGILASSRYPLAMARDGLIPERFAYIGRFQTPVVSIGITAFALIVFILVLNVAEVAKLASALQLAIFAMVNIAVIVMRESQIEAYDPGFRSPLYPWMQLAGIIIPLLLVGEMGWLAVLFTFGVLVGGIAWFHYYARSHIAREGAIFHVFARLGRRRFVGLDRELRDIMKEKGLRAEDPFDEVVARASVIDMPESGGLKAVIGHASELLDDALPATAQELTDGFLTAVSAGGTPIARGAVLLHTRLPELETSEMVLVRCRHHIDLDLDDERLQRQAAHAHVPIQAAFLVVSGENDPGRHLRILAQLAGRIENTEFISEWLAGEGEQDLKETLLRDERFLALRLTPGTRSEALIGKALRELDMPEGSLVALIRRYGVTMVPRGRTVLREGDRLTVIGDPVGLETLATRYTDGD